MEVPGGKEEGEEVGDSGAFETEASVFPMPVESFEVGVFVGEVDAAGVANLPVDDDNFAMVAVVMKAVEAGIEFVGRSAVNADGFEITVIAGGEGENAANVVVHNVDLDALLDFGLECGKDFVPDTTGADDEEFEENEGSGGFEVGKEALEISFTIREIGGLSVFREGDVVGFADVAGLEGGDRIFFLEGAEGGVIGVEGFELGGEFATFVAEGLIAAIAGEDDEEEWADDGKAHNNEGPEEAHFEVMIIIDDIEGDGEGEENGENGDREEVAIEKEVEGDKDDEFGEDDKDSPSEAVGEEAF